MTRNFGLVAPALLSFGLMAYACTSGEVVEGPLTGTAGSSTPGTAGTTGAGAGPGSSGTTGSGARGGTTGQGAGPGSSGTTGSGARGGTTGAGAGPGSSGTTGSGARGGTTGTAGTVGTAGTTGAGGTGTASCPPSFSVSSNGFVQMPVSGGCWSGYPYTYADSFGTTVMPAPMAAWTTNTLKLTGNIVANAPPNYAYAGIGFSIGQTASGTPTLLSPTGNGLTFNVTNSTTGAGVVIRAQVTNGTTAWCKDMTTFPATIPYDGFTVNCYTAGGAKYAKEPIKGIEVNVAGGTATGTINVTINSITEN
jgi:hypothetical protein